MFREIRRRSASSWIWCSEAVMKARGWLAYLIGGVLFSNGIAEVGLVVFLIGMIVDWKIWFLGFLAFFVGVYST